VKVLAVSDQPSEYLWGPGVEQGLKGIDVILSCGDLPPLYLSFLATFTNAPVFYVHGNHDSCYDRTPPEGCMCVDDKLVVWNGLRILGLGGSIRYNREGVYQYTQQQMKHRARRRWLSLRRQGGIDILLTHAPAKGIGDADDRAHEGFQVFLDLMDRWHPAVLVHGHCHLNYNYKQQRLTQYGETRIINAFERYTFEVEV